MSNREYFVDRIESDDVRGAGAELAEAAEAVAAEVAGEWV